MDNFVYNIFDSYFNALEKTGYIKQSSVNSLLILNFFYNMMYRDYRGYISEEDYHTLDKALNCLYGTNCLISYPDYLKMGKLHLGEMTEVLSRTKSLESYTEELDKRILDNDALIADNTKRIDEHGTRLDVHDSRLNNHDRQLADHNARITTNEHNIEVHDRRLDTIEATKVIKRNKDIRPIEDIDIPDIDISIP